MHGHDLIVYVNQMLVYIDCISCYLLLDACNTAQNKHFEEFSEAAQVEFYRSASLQLNIVKLRLRFHSGKYSCHFQILYI